MEGKIQTVKDAMDHLTRVADDDPANGGSIAYTATDLAEVAGMLLDEGHWCNLQPFSERDVLALTIMRDCLSPKIRR